MPLLTLSPEEYAKINPETPLWQSLEWKNYQESIGRQTRLYGLKNASGGFSATALVIVDKTAFGLSTWDIPRGPVFDDPEAGKELINHIKKEAKKDHCMTLYFSPYFPLSSFHFPLSKRNEQPTTTIVLNLTLTDDELMKQMKPKGRYNVRLAQKKGITVTESDDVNAFYELLEKTSKRDGFQIKPKSHYEKFLSVLPNSFLLLIYPPEESAKCEYRNVKNDDVSHFALRTSHLDRSSHFPIAALLGTIHNKTGFYYYGASDDRYKALMAPYLLQWEAMRLCKSRGCITYDLLGIAPEDDPKHPWAGITRFKKQFGGEIVEYPPEREVVLRPVTKRLIEWKRRVLG